MKKINKAKQVLYFILSFVLFGTASLAGNTKAPVKKQTENCFNIIKQNNKSLVINFSLPSFVLSKEQINGLPIEVINIQGNIIPAREGTPGLPVFGRYVAIPEGSVAKLNYKLFTTTKYNNITLPPAPCIPFSNEDGPLIYSKNLSVYSKDEFYPSEPVLISETSQMRGVDVVMLGITPFQYNPVTRELLVYQDIQIEIEFLEGSGNFGEERLRNKWWDPILSNHLLNYKSFAEIDYNKMISPNAKETGAEYLIICPNGPVFQQWADSIKLFRNKQGISTKVATLSEIGGNDVNLIESYINNAWFTWDIPPVAVLFLGDYGTNPDNSVISPVYNGYCVSDNIYADVDEDNLPDIIAARLPAQNATELETMITRFINNERTPPETPGFYDHPITSCLFIETSWNQLLTESVAGFYEVAYDKNTNRINAGPDSIPEVWSTAPNSEELIFYFGPDGLGYIPSSPTQLNCSWTSTAQDMEDGINDGAFMVLHDSHGSVQGWGNPAFGNNNIDNLINTDLPFVWSPNCLNGKFNYASDCFAERFLKHKYAGENSGALGIVAPSEITYTFVNEVLTWGAFDHMWPEFLPDFGTTPESNGIYPAFANVAAKYFLDQSTWTLNPNVKDVTYHLYHYFGDAFLMVYSEAPQELTVSHANWLLQGTTTFEVSANEGSLIALSVNGELISTAEGTGAIVTLTIPPQYPPDEVLVTITKQNFYRYEALVPVGTGTGFSETGSRDQVKIYPNPTNGMFYINCNAKSPVNITVLNVTNEVVWQEIIKGSGDGVYPVSLASLPAGVYFVKIGSKDNWAVRKLVRQ
ncbi:MAG: T9SS type A sorting domain-containing protein [Bacteroidales bacterium]|nr:T9SS type A sorting domain-containing protein [Bacteroidales bacterium]